MTRHLIWGGGVVAVWVMLWDSLRLANVAGGALVAVGLLTLFPLARVTEHHRARFRPLAFVRLAATVLKDLAVSNVVVAGLILRPRPRVTTRVVRCRMHTDSPALLASVANIIALAPGMMAIEADDEPALLVHGLGTTEASVRERVARLERLVVDAFGSDADRRRCLPEAT